MIILPMPAEEFVIGTIPYGYWIVGISLLSFGIRTASPGTSLPMLAAGENRHSEPGKNRQKRSK